MQYLTSMIHFFAEHPLAAIIVSLVFIVPCFYPVYSGKQKSLLLPCSMAWLAFGMWIFYELGQEANVMEVAHPGVFVVLLVVASLGLMIVIKGLFQRSTVSCSID